MRSSNREKCPAIPRATYRLQLNSQFTLTDAKKIIPYLKELGVSHVYSSPLLTAQRGSMHCYDVVSHTELNPEIGSEREFEEFCRLLSRNGMGLLLDIVPNHMSASLENKLWFDVLEKGSLSKYADYFDIDWASPKSKGKVILPILGARLDQVLRAGDLKLVSDFENSLRIYLELYGKRLPISIQSYPLLLRQIDHELIPFLHELVGDLRSYDEDSDEAGNLANKITSALDQEKIQRSLKKVLKAINSRVRTDTGWKKFHEFLNLQCYKLEYWYEAMKRVNYRRFVYVNDLVAINMEDKAVFKESHSLIREWIERGLVQALRVDHVDGLRDPREYLVELRRMFTNASSRNARPFLAIEKILLGDELLRADWKISGTTGYEFIQRTNGLFVSRQNKKMLERIYKTFTGTKQDFEDIATDSKRVIAKRFMQPDIDRLIRIALGFKLPMRFERVSASGLRHAIEEASLHLPVYRTYVSSSIEEKDRSIIKAVLVETRRAIGFEKRSVDLLEHLLVSSDEKGRPRYEEFCLRFQQLTPTISAKGLEDTAFYRYFPLSSLNEVSGDPSVFGSTVEDFHAKNLEIAKQWPNSMLASSTHDTKWSEDSRARLDVLSEFPADWKAAIYRWSRINQRFKTRVGRNLSPTRNDEYLLYEALLATLPDGPDSVDEGFVNRLVGFMRKASKEEKRETDWMDSDPAYDSALERFVRKIFDQNNHEFLESLKLLSQKLKTYGFYNSLSQLLLRLTCPGVPDIYQGCETWNLRMVDPDNRSPVDFRSLITSLSSISNLSSSPGLARSLFSRHDNGLIKMYLLKNILNFRKGNADLFDFGEYVPIKCAGKLASNLVSYARQNRSSKIIVVASRFYSEICEVNELPVGNVWKGTYSKLPNFCGEYTNIFTNEKVQISKASGFQLNFEQALSSLPFCLLSG